MLPFEGTNEKNRCPSVVRAPQSGGYKHMARKAVRPGAKQQDPWFRLEFKTQQWLLGEKANSQVFLQGMCLERELPVLGTQPHLKPKVPQKRGKWQFGEKLLGANIEGGKTGESGVLETSRQVRGSRGCFQGRDKI